MLVLTLPLIQCVCGRILCAIYRVSAIELGSCFFLLFIMVLTQSLSLSLSLLGERTYKDTDELRQLAIGITVTDDKSLGGSAEK